MLDEDSCRGFTLNIRKADMIWEFYALFIHKSVAKHKEISGSSFW